MSTGVVAVRSRLCAHTDPGPMNIATTTAAAVVAYVCQHMDPTRCRLQPTAHATFMHVLSRGVSTMESAYSAIIYAAIRK